MQLIEIKLNLSVACVSMIYNHVTILNSLLRICLDSFRILIYRMKPSALEGGLLTYIRHNITFTHLDNLRNINTHNTELQLVKIHTNRNKHFTIANLYMPPKDTASPYRHNILH